MSEKNLDRDVPIFVEIVTLLKNRSLEDAERLILQSYKSYPNRPEPHNLMGILLEKRYDHDEAMKHFRIALELDPTYLPAQYNLLHYGTFYPQDHCAYLEEECYAAEDETLDSDPISRIVYGHNQIGRLFRRNKK